MPVSYEDAKKIIGPFFFPMESYDVCKNDCIIFRKEHLTQLIYLINKHKFKDNLKRCPIRREDQYYGSRLARQTFT